MAEYSIQLKTSVASSIEAIESDRERRVVRWRIAALKGDPRPASAETFPGYPHRYRLLHERYRIVYSVDEEMKQVTIVAVGARKR